MALSIIPAGILRRVIGPPRPCLLTRQNVRCFTVLALESSADDTCAAIVNSDREIVSNVVVKQHSFHEQFGGIHPMHAIWAHQRHMPGAVRKALHDAGMTMNSIDGIAYTRGPGMAGCLSVCSNAAKTLAAATSKPIVGVHHMQAHALMPLLTTPDISFPFLTLLISGGHTLLLLARSWRSFQTLATTPDESIGNAFDKVSKMLKIPWGKLGPGAALEQYCLNDYDQQLPEIIPPLPSGQPGKLAFSYSGLHSGVERYIAVRNGDLDDPTKLALARAFQTAAVGQLEEKLLLALHWCRQNGVVIRDIIVSGGVASNKFLRRRLEFACRDFKFDDAAVRLVSPPQELCTDNAVMIGWASMDRFLAQDYDEYEIETRPKWDIQELQ
ncbi:peptidase M22, glycoprotease [Thelephora ganbajun]|uniref:Peptidase M22, glycoprotease n=1 Tax=Thelephora ganbajun TaxID=370292 RepID=A0ACB6ZJC0_THEGA|nr:peptidase M22, glycoprotease [Thelephora ganbajun]